VFFHLPGPGYNVPLVPPSRRHCFGVQHQPPTINRASTIHLLFDLFRPRSNVPEGMVVARGLGHENGCTIHAYLNLNFTLFLDAEHYKINVARIETCVQRHVQHVDAMAGVVVYSRHCRAHSNNAMGHFTSVSAACSAWCLPKAALLTRLIAKTAEIRYVSECMSPMSMQNWKYLLYK